ncbi:MAG TPA: NRDE family protein [Geminicoccaceae bacterium]
MCTLVLSRRPGAAWPLLLAANRDELADRPALPPARHWPDRAEVVAGMDLQAGGSWLGINDHGVVAGVLNRPGTLGPAAGKRSRGELVLEALDHADAAAAAHALSDLDPDAFRPFNLVIADNRDAFWLRHAGALPGFALRTASGAWREIAPHHMPDAALGGAARPTAIERRAIPAGVSMITAHDLNDLASPRIRRYLPQFRGAPTPDPSYDDWHGWIALLADRDSEDGDPHGAMTVVTDGAYGTLSSCLIALPARGTPVMKFADGRPDQVPFEPVPLRASRSDAASDRRGA